MLLSGEQDDLIETLWRSFHEGPFLERRIGRALTLQALYEMDLAHHGPARVFDRLAAQTAGARLSEPWTQDTLTSATGYARSLMDGVLTNRSSIDALIHERAPAWPLEQMSAVDRNVLRIGLYESLFSNAKVPVKAAINEAVELAKLFGSDTSARFVNGVLGRAIESNHAKQPTAGDTDETVAEETLPATGPTEPSAGDA